MSNSKDGFSQFVLVDADYIPQQSRLAYDLYIQTKETKRLLLYRRQGLPFDQEAIEELKRMNAKVFISEKEWSKVVEQKGQAMADLIKKGASPEVVSKAAGDTVKRIAALKPGENLNKALRDCSSVVEQTVESFQGSNLNVTFEKLDSILIKRDDLFLSHARNTSTMAVLFGMVLGVQDDREVVDLGIAGFLYDCGLSGIDPNVLELYFSGDTATVANGSKEYQDHPENSVKLAIARGIPLSLRAKQAILEHHERVDGEGFPYGLAGEQISKLARILSIADSFVGRLSAAEQEGNADPVKIFAEMVQENTGADGALDPEMLSVIQEKTFSVVPGKKAA